MAQENTLYGDVYLDSHKSYALLGTDSNGLVFDSKYPVFPHASVSDSTTQTNGTATLAYPITFDTQEDIHAMTHSTSVNSSRIYIAVEGAYLIVFSTVLRVSTNDDSIDIWLRVDGVNVPRTNTISRMKNATTERCVAVSYSYHFDVGQYFELMWCCTENAGAELLATSAGINPTRPACPSTIMTVNMISKDIS